MRVDSGTSLALHFAGVLRPPGMDAAPRAPACKALEALLDRAEATTCSGDLTRYLCERFGVSTAGSDAPLGALTRAARGQVVGDDVFALLSVVHLHVDRDRAYVVPLAERVVAEAESVALQGLLDEALGGWCHDVERETNTLWTLRLRNPAALRTTPVESAAGQDARECLPQGDDARQWLTLANELQMLLHSHPVNEQRQRDGQLVLNSVWLWGVGAVPRVTQRPYACVYSDRAFVRGLAAASGVPHAPAPHGLTLPPAGEARPTCIALFDAFDGGSGDWTAIVERLERDWFAPLLAALRDRALARATLWLGNGRRYRIDARQATRWRWRRPRVLASYAMTAPAT